jgi:glutathione S-transferase
MTTTRKLVQMSYSPWSERARWALDHHGLSYQTIEHQPFLGELRLRRIVARKGPGRATVPVLIDGDTLLTQSWEIAQYADRNGSGMKLILPGEEARLWEWVDLADRASNQGRGLVIAGLASDGALDESIPFPIPSFLLPLMRPVTRFGLRWFARKYGLGAESLTEIEDRLRPTLDRLRDALKSSRYLLGTFSYADIAMATTLQGISPVGNGFIKLGPATRRAWTRPVLERDYADLLRWRDNLYAEHRGRSQSVIR